MRGVNKVIIIGTMGADPDSKKFDNGGMVTNISVATSEQWTDKQSGEKRESTEWHRVVFNGRLAEISAQYLRKGSKVYIEGVLKTRKYTAQDGSDRFITEIKAMQLQMLDSAGGAPANSTGNSNSNQQPGNKASYKPDNNAQGHQKPTADKAASISKTNPAIKNNGFDGPVDDDIPF